MTLSNPPTGDAALDLTYYIDLSTDPDFTSFICIWPESLTFDDAINGIGNVAFQVSFSATDVEDNLIVSHDFVHPWGTYYRLRCGSTVIHAGVITSHNVKLGDEYCSVAGKTWEAYFSRWQYPFDPRDGHINDFVFTQSFQFNELIASGGATPPGFVYQAYQRDIALILGDLISQAMNIVPYRMIFDLSDLASTIGIVSNFQLSQGDTSYYDSIIDGLSQTGAGFDWWVSDDRKFNVGSPYRFGSQMAPTLSATITSEVLPPVAIEFTNTGPAFTHLLAEGAGLSNRLGAALGLAGNQAAFTRLDGSIDFGDVRNRSQLLGKARKEFSLGVQPQHQIPISLDPAEIPDYWEIFRKGRAIYILYDLKSHLIDSPQRLKSYTCTVSDEGNATVNHTLEQIYPQAFSAGDEEG